jgi:hypothetical protein
LTQWLFVHRLNTGISNNPDFTTTHQWHDYGHISQSPYTVTQPYVLKEIFVQMALQSRAFLFSLAESGQYSDFILVCGDHQFKLHQVIVYPQSPVITAALSGGFQVQRYNCRRWRPLLIRLLGSYIENHHCERLRY